MAIRSLKDKKCVITGAASGIGRATAVLAAAEGAELFLTDVNDRKLEDTVAAIRGAGGKVTACRALDISDFEAVRSFAGEIQATSGTMDVVMNIAGISVWGAVENMGHRYWKKVIDINLMGPLSYALSPKSREDRVLPFDRGGQIRVEGPWLECGHQSPGAACSLAGAAGSSSGAAGSSLRCARSWLRARPVAAPSTPP